MCNFLLYRLLPTLWNEEIDKSRNYKWHWNMESKIRKVLLIKSIISVSYNEIKGEETAYN